MKKNNHDFMQIVKDILVDPDIQALARINHHGNSILDHSLKVARLAWSWGVRLNLDHHSIARGALLHDFFLYDWKRKRPESRKKIYEISKMHGFTHPSEALRNAKQRFHLNSTEEDIILYHMFPLTLIPPHTKEGWLVSICDKWVSLMEIPQYLSYLFK